MRELTTRGAFLGGFMGLFTAVLLMILGPTVWVDLLGHDAPVFPYKYPALFSMTAAFAGLWFFSITDRSAGGRAEREAFAAQYVRSQTGLGAEGAVRH